MTHVVAAAIPFEPVVGELRNGFLGGVVERRLAHQHSRSGGQLLFPRDGVQRGSGVRSRAVVG